LRFENKEKMNNVTELIENLQQKGVQLWVEGDKLKIRSPKGTIAPELQQELSQNKAKILDLLQTEKPNVCHEIKSQISPSLGTIGRLVSGISIQNRDNFKMPTIEPMVMAKKLKVTFKPLSNNYQNTTIIDFRKNLETKLSNYGVQIIPWERATKDLSYAVNIPLLNRKKQITTKVVLSEISAVINVETRSSLIDRIKTSIADKIYYLYSRYILKDRKLSVTKIGQLIAWAESNVHAIEDPSNTQNIILTELDPKFSNFDLPYAEKIPIGIGKLVKNFSEIAIGISADKIAILNMNLADSIFPISEVDRFVQNSLIPKIYVPLLPLPMSQFAIEKYDPQQLPSASQLVELGQKIATTNLLPTGFKIDDIIKRKSHRDIIDWIVKGRTGVSYGFVANIEPPQYIGAIEITSSTWETLAPISGFSYEELRQDLQGRRYLRIRQQDTNIYHQIPELWVLSSRSGANKTNLNLDRDILRLGIKDGLILQLPQNCDPAIDDIKPSYDIYVMVAIAIGAALYTPKLIENGASIVHFHGYPHRNWFGDSETWAGVKNPSVPCGTYESGVFNFLGIKELGDRHPDLNFATLIEPDHGTNFIASDTNYLLDRIQTGVKEGQIELGGKHFSSLL
jgi:TubC N-terminal docking domain